MTAAESARTTVLVIAPNLGEELQWIRKVDPRLTVVDGNLLARTLEGGECLLQSAEVILLGYPIPSGIAQQAPRLRWVHHTQAGVSNLHRTDLWDSPVTITSSRGHVASTEIAEYVMAGAYFFARGLDEATRQKAAAAQLDRSKYVLGSLTGATMGVVGLGGIGREVARLARAVGMQVIATRRSVARPARNTESVDLLLPPDRLIDLAAASEYVAICAQLTPQTRGIIGREVFAAMEPGTVLINIARGELLDEDALIAALHDGQIRGAVLDVYERELEGRPPRRELIQLSQIVLTPHVSILGAVEGHEPVKRLFAENLRRYLDGRPLLNLVDRERGY